MFPRPNAKLDLNQLHKAIHNLVLSRREDIGFWNGIFETAWAGHIFAAHSADNQDATAINFIKGELLGNKRPSDLHDTSELAACYMAAVFLNRVKAEETAKEFVIQADKVTEELANHVDLDERFHLFSSPEYLYAIVMAHYVTYVPFSPEIATLTDQAIKQIQEDEWYQNAYVFALAGTAYLTLHDYLEDICKQILLWLLTQSFDRLDEHSIPLVWFLEHHWSRIQSCAEKAQQMILEKSFITLRSKLLDSLDLFDFQLAWQSSTEITFEEQISNNLMVVSTVELLMLDEITEKHSRQSYVLTQEEIDRHSLLSTVFEQYKQLVDTKLAIAGLGDDLNAVYQGLESDNPASWQQSILGCRNILYGLSKILWQVTNEQYKMPDGSVISVKPDKEKNRLMAYLYHKGVSKSKEPVFMAQFEAVTNLMRALIDKSAKAKHMITYEEAVSSLVSMYVLLAEMIMLTDLQPVINLEE